MATTPALTSFTLFRSSSSKPARQIAINPAKVLAVRETVHGSVVIAYSAKETFEVEGPYDQAVRIINLGRVPA